MSGLPAPRCPSMEPRPRGRGNPGPARRGVLLALLPSMEPRPRGRGHAHRRMLSCPRRHRPFNGAPTSRPGKLRGRLCVTTSASSLQWSPDPAAGETRSVSVQRFQSCDPSMEPRPRGRGNVTCGTRHTRPLDSFNGAPTSRPGKRPVSTTRLRVSVSLQWSPDLAAGETTLLLSMFPGFKYLQWSPDLAAGETPTL